jgi:hypothetical protein
MKINDEGYSYRGIRETSDLHAAYVKGWDAALRRAAFICRGVNNHDNPMTANDCADEILALVKEHA